MENIILTPDVLATTFLLCLKQNELNIPRDVTEKILKMTAEPVVSPRDTYVRSKKLQGHMDRWAKRST